MGYCQIPPKNVGFLGIPKNSHGPTAEWLGVRRRTPLPRPVARLRAGLRRRTLRQLLRLRPSHGRFGAHGGSEGAGDDLKMDEQ